MTRRRYGWGMVLAGVLAASAWATSSAAEVPSGITQQGRLLDSDGEPVSGQTLMVFTIYDSPTESEEANVLWTETHEVTLDEGYFSVRLGDDGDNPFPAGLFDGSVRHLGLRVGTDDEMTPRERIASVPYALVANDAVGDIHPTSVTVGGTKVIDEDGKWVGEVPFRSNSTLLTRVEGTPGTSAGGTNRTATCPANTSATGGGCNFQVGGDATTGYLKASYPSVSGSRPNGWICRAQGATNTGDASAAGSVTAYAICIDD